MYVGRSVAARRNAGGIVLINTIHRQLRIALEAHALDVVENDGVLLVDGGRLELQGSVFDRDTVPGNAAVVLEVQARSGWLDQPIIECFAGIGASRDQAIADAFGKMLLGSFHVLIEGLTRHSCQEAQAEIEHWTGVNSGWTVFSGPLLTQHAGNSTLSAIYPDFLAQLTSLFVATVPSGPHWVRVFLGAYHDKIQATEVLLDNAPWAQGQSLLTAQEWPCTHEYQSIRHFMLALPEAVDRIDNAHEPTWISG